MGLIGTSSAVFGATHSEREFGSENFLFATGFSNVILFGGEVMLSWGGGGYLEE